MITRSDAGKNWLHQQWGRFKSMEKEKHDLG